MTKEEFKLAVEYEQKSRAEISERWRKLHSYLNSLLELECTDECITDDDELILKVSEKLSSKIEVWLPEY